MASDAENLATARARICQELAEGPIKPNYEIEGQRVDWSTYRRDLIRQLKDIDDLNNVADDGSGIAIEETVWRT